jgi:predicted PurR-regulated permease PerM
MNNQLQASPVRTAIEIAVNLLLIFIILAWCLQILRPFISFIVWGAVIAIAMYKPFLKLQSAVGGRKKLAVALFAILGLAVVLVPAWMFAGSILDTTTEVKTVLESGDVNIQPPNESVKEWPVIGEKLHAQWSAAAVNFGDWIEANSEFIKTVTNKLFSKVAEIGLGVLHAETIGEGMNRLFRRLVGDRAEGMLMLTTSTVQSVTVGVLGIAFIQAFLGGLGMVVAGVPAAGVWALLILILGIAQLPPLLILIPAMIYVFSVESTTVAVIFMIWSLLVSFSDMVLKPLLLGRGVEAPMLVILLGAIGGMIMSGIIGLFVGAVVLAIGYVLLQSWLELGEPEGGDASDPA